MGAGAPMIDSLAIVLPRDWVDIPLNSTAFESYFRSRRQHFIGSGSDGRHRVSKTDLRRLDVIIAALRNDVESANVRMLAALVMSVDGETEDDSEDPTEEGIGRAGHSGVVRQDPLEGEEPGLLLATVSVSVLSRFELGSDVPLTPSVLKVAFDLERERSSDEDIRVTNLEAPKIVEIRAGEAVKLVQLHSNARAVPEPADLFVQQFYVPLDPNGDEAALVLFTSPSVEVARVLSGLFDAMMETFEILPIRTETDLHGVSPPENGLSRTRTTDASEADSNRPSIGGHM